MERILKVLEEQGLPQMLIVDPLLIYCLMECADDPYERFFRLLLRKDGQYVLFLDKLFYASENSGVKEVWFSDTDPVVEVVASYLIRGAVLGVDKELTTRFLPPPMKKKAAAGFVNSSLAVDKTCGMRDVEEQEKIRRASDINDTAMAKFRPLVHEGATEWEIVDQMLQIYQDLDVGGFSFTSPVASGANAIDPHHGPDDTVLREGDCVLFDAGCVEDHYCSDMTCTFYYKSASEHCCEVYETTHAVNEVATAIIRPGVRLYNTDKAAQNLTTAKGHGPQFNHRLRHFVGLKDHRFSDASLASDWKVESGMIFSIEPGIYLVGDAGVCAKDLVMMTENGVGPLNRYSHELDMTD